MVAVDCYKLTSSTVHLPSVRCTSGRELSPQHSKRWLVAITVFSALLCFIRLSTPPPLTDEAFTFWRTCGSFSQMLDTLRLDAFMPLHYQIVWVAMKLFGQDIWALRLWGPRLSFSLVALIYRSGP